MRLGKPGKLIDASFLRGPRGRNSVGRMPASQAGRRRFESGRPLLKTLNGIRAVCRSMAATALEAALAPKTGGSRAAAQRSVQA